MNRDDVLRGREVARLARSAAIAAKRKRERRVRAGVAIGSGAAAGAAMTAWLMRAGTPHTLTMTGGAIAALLGGAVALRGTKR